MKTSTPHPLTRRRFMAASSALVAASGLGSAFAQGSDTIRLVVPFPPGGGTDVLGRAFALRFGAQLQKSVIVDNRGGASGAVGTELVARAPKDGKTLLFAGIVPAPKVYAEPALFEQLTPISIVARTPYMLVVRPDLPVNSLADLVKLAKSKPGKLNFGTPGDGTPHHIGMEMFNTVAKTDIVAVPYKGTGPMINDVAGGQLDGTFGTVASVEALVASGRLKPLATTGSERWEKMPNVPTVAESGYPGFRADIGYAIYAPAGTPKATIEAYNAAAREALKNKELLETLRAQGFSPAASTPKEVSDVATKEMQFVRGLARSGKVNIAL